ncbi:hypothetical protein AV530_000302 [Patagioenas fasciata monilis]|uniref:Uncharacterized protein n=1 Tax=Patagioenas fasciata monilis TaxID=372326 RepID=A0A1V4KDB8_PATFA|nr:hypothetical protein AV530_000302 [Patagioenas fasciata monilis]
MQHDVSLGNGLKGSVCDCSLCLTAFHYSELQGMRMFYHKLLEAFRTSCGSQFLCKVSRNEEKSQDSALQPGDWESKKVSEISGFCLRTESGRSPPGNPQICSSSRYHLWKQSP